MPDDFHKVALQVLVAGCPGAAASPAGPEQPDLLLLLQHVWLPQLLYVQHVLLHAPEQPALLMLLLLLLHEHHHLAIFIVSPFFHRIRCRLSGKCPVCDALVFMHSLRQKVLLPWKQPTVLAVLGNALAFGGPLHRFLWHAVHSMLTCHHTLWHAHLEVNAAGGSLEAARAMLDEQHHGLDKVQAHPGTLHLHMIIVPLQLCALSKILNPW